MTALPPHPRYERKFVAPGLMTSAEVLAVIRRHPAVFREVFPPRLVNNIYLDTPSLGNYQDHLHGRSRRVKTRIRWYGEIDGRVEKPMLERKIKDGLLSGKAAYPLPAFVVSRARTRSSFQEILLGAELPDALRLALGHVEPVLMNQYWRRYFQSADRRFRLTVDTGLCSWALSCVAGSVAPAIRHVPGVIIELKFDPRYAGDAADITGVLPFRLTRFSKYVAGIQRMPFSQPTT